MHALPRFALRLSAFALLALALGGLSAGCAPSKTPVKGTVKFNGKPVVYGSVTLVASDGIIYTGEIKEDGTFTIPDVPSGNAKVGVLSPNPTPATGANVGGKGLDPGLARGDRRAPPPPESVIKAWFPIPDKYGDPLTSGLTEEVKSGKDLAIDLK